MKLFESTVLLRSIPPSTTVDVAPLTVDEANALRYSAGYVPFSLRKKLKKRPEFKKWLECLAVEGEETSYLDYTKKWTEAVDRGGLFKVNDKAYQFFLDLEMRVRKHLPSLLGPNSKSLKKDVVDDIVTSDDVLFSWMTVTADFDDEGLSSELLRYIVDLWLTIRGFSAAGAWMEYYKQCKDTGTKREHGLRKNLKRKRLEMTDEAEIT